MGTKTDRIEKIEREIKRLRKLVWKDRTEEDKKNGTGWVNLDYTTMSRIDELHDELDDLQKDVPNGKRQSKGILGRSKGAR